MAEDQTFTQADIDVAVAKATEGSITQAQMDAAIAKAVSDAVASTKEQVTSQAQADLAKERSKREEIANRLKDAKKQQVPVALDGLEPDVVESLIEAAKYAKGLSDDKRVLFMENMSSGNFQNMLVQQRNNWIKTDLEPKEQRIADLEAELQSVRAESVRAKRSSPLKDAVIAHINPDKDAQKDAYRRISEMFEDGLDDEGNLIAKQSGDLMGIDPVTNKPFTPETAAKYLADKVFYFAKPSSTQKADGQGHKPTQKSDSVSITEQLKGLSQEEQKALYAKRAAERRASS